MLSLSLLCLRILYTPSYGVVQYYFCIYVYERETEKKCSTKNTIVNIEHCALLVVLQQKKSNDIVKIHLSEHTTVLNEENKSHYRVLLIFKNQKSTKMSVNTDFYFNNIEFLREKFQEQICSNYDYVKILKSKALTLKSNITGKKHVNENINNHQSTEEMEKAMTDYMEKLLSSEANQQLVGQHNVENLLTIYEKNEKKSKDPDHFGLDKKQTKMSQSHDVSDIKWPHTKYAFGIHYDRNPYSEKLDLLSTKFAVRCVGKEETESAFVSKEKVLEPTKKTYVALLFLIAQTDT